MARLFGTNGVRGVVGDVMTPELLLGLGRAVGTTMPGPVLVGTDTRTSGPVLKAAFIAGVRSTGTDVVDCGIAPTPAVQYGVKVGGYGTGAVITASHNPPEFNGIKLVESDGTEAVAATEARVEEAYFDEAFTEFAYDHVGAEAVDTSPVDRYIDACVDAVDADAIRAAGLKVVMDCANGAGVRTGPEVMRRLGVHVVTLNAQPDGTFPGHASEPTPENLRDTLAAVPAMGADVGAILDGDADRCIFATSDGSFVPGERTLTLGAKAAVEAHEGGVVVTPVSSSKSVEDAVVAAGGEIRYTAVGSPIVAREMIATDSVFGGEENGGLIFPDHQYCRDGTMTAAWMCDLLAATGRPLHDLLAELPRYELIKVKVPCPEALKQPVMDALAATIEAEASGRVDRTDGVRVDRDDGWILCRPSGTEPLFRVFAEAADRETAEALSTWGREQLDAAMKKAGN